MTTDINALKEIDVHLLWQELVKRLRVAEECHQHALTLAKKEMARAEAAEAERDRLKGVLVKIEQGDYERSGRNFYNTTTRTPSKHDTCGHGKAYWDDCGNCCSSFARSALEAKP